MYLYTRGDSAYAMHLCFIKLSCIFLLQFGDFLSPWISIRELMIVRACKMRDMKFARCLINITCCMFGIVVLDLRSRDSSTHVTFFFSVMLVTLKPLSL